MPKVTFIAPDGSEVIADNAEGNLMNIAVENQVDGIDGDCGGVCSCATCHIKVSADWKEKVGPASEAETDMLELEEDVDESSRLGCQIKMTEELDGLVVTVVGR